MLNASDLLLLGWLLLAGLATLWTREPSVLIGAIGALGALLVLLAWLDERSLLWRILHDFDPIFFILACFFLLGPVLTPLHPATWDGQLAAVDQRAFSQVAGAWRGVLARPSWLTDLASLAYVTYYFMPVLLGIRLWRRDRREPFDAYVFATVLCFILTWLGYALFPARGPRVVEAEAAAVLGGGAVSAGVRAFLRIAERYRLNAFPSGHTALALVWILATWRPLPRWRIPLVALGTMIIFSTVYLSAHYVVDVLAGAALAVLTVLVTPRVRRLLAPPAAPLNP